MLVSRLHRAAPVHKQTAQISIAADQLPCLWHAVGILAVQCCKHRGAARIILIDPVANRLDFAHSKLPYVETIDASKHTDVRARLREMVKEGPHVSIEAVGFHYTKSLVSKLEMAVGLQTDPSDMLNEMIVSTRKVSPGLMWGWRYL